MVYTYFSGWALFSSPKGSLIASFTFVPEPLITTPKLDFQVDKLTTKEDRGG